MQGSLTVAFSSHRAEALPLARREMERHQVIVLEEAPSPDFPRMLRGDLPVDEYLMQLDSGFPQFQRLMCGVLEDLHGRGKKILQMEPYLERLTRIHDLFAEGKRPEDILKMEELRKVYLAEKDATGLLIDYYRHSVTSPFEKVIESVKAFARADATRLNLRARMRGDAISKVFRSDEPMYVESGYIHYSLYLYLRRHLGGSHKVRAIFLLQPILKRLKAKRRNMGPGDILTLLYMLHSAIDEALGSLLAARSVIYVKLIETDELVPGQSSAPHSEDEAAVIQVVDSLRLEECKYIFDKIRFKARDAAWETVKDYLTARRIDPSGEPKAHG